MLPEVYFLRYAFPCTEGKVHRGEISREDFEKLERAANKQEALPKKFLEKVYKMAVEEMKEVAKERNKTNPWDLEVIAEYFLIRHNEIIERGKGFYKDAPKAARDYCKTWWKNVKVVKVASKFLIVEINGQRKNVLRYENFEVKEGDNVVIHQSHATENLNNSSSIAKKFLEKIGKE